MLCNYLCPRGYTATPRQLIKVVFGLRDTIHGTLIGDDSTLMDMDAPGCLPAGSTHRVEPLRNHPDPKHHDYFVTRETTVFREPLADGNYA